MIAWTIIGNGIALLVLPTASTDKTVSDSSMVSLRAEIFKRAKDENYVESWADTWREAVVFDDHDELYRPVEWDRKLEILEAQVIANSGHTKFPKLINSLSISESPNSLKWTREVLWCVIKNCEELQRARYCGSSINIIVGDQKRYNVARLIRIKFDEITHFVSWFERFCREYDERRDASIDHLKECLHECSSFLKRLGLDFYPFHDRYDRHDLWGGGEYEIISSRNALLSKIFYSTRAIAMVLDLGVISFSGAHLRPFDQALYGGRAESYFIPCDGKQASIVLNQWQLGCLEGFCLENPVWVFSVHESQTSSRISLSRINETRYLSATPEEFASIWGPAWKSASKKRPDAILWYVVSPGFLIPGHWSESSPEILEGEVLCHWTNDPAELNEHESFPSQERCPRLLIGANRFKLSKNISCRLDPASFSSKMEHENRLRILGTSRTRWAWSDKITAQLSASAHLGLASFGPSLSRDIQKKKGVTAKENLRAKMATEPGKHLPFLWKSLGVEISACTGNARRVTLIELLGTNTISKYLKNGTGLQWGPGEFDKWLDALAPKSVKGFCNRYAEASRRNGGRLAKHFDDALKLAFVALACTGLHGSSIDALWEFEGDPLTIEIPKYDQKWAGMLSDDEKKCALVVMSQTCLQCTAANLLCRIRHPRPLAEELSVFETRLVLNYLGKVPQALASFPHYHRWTPEMIKALKPGDEFEMHPSGVLRVIKPLNDGKGIFVEWVHSILPRWSNSKRRYNNLVRSVQRRGKEDNRHHEYIEPFESSLTSIPVFVVSNYREFASWAPWRLKGRK